MMHAVCTNLLYVRNWLCSSWWVHNDAAPSLTAPSTNVLEERRQSHRRSWRAVTTWGASLWILLECPHCPRIRPCAESHDLQRTVNAPCTDCGSAGENMLCLMCETVRCGRHVQGHMKKHAESSTHPMTMGFADLSIWCYPCDNYVSSYNRFVFPWYAAAHVAKFGCAPGK